jgi:acyl-CoA synthetase (AMP-forming)/AMP-acid ligase II
MANVACLHERFIASARQSPQAVAVVEPGKGSISYSDLDALSDRCRDRLALLGVCRGDRVGIYLRKSVDAVAALLGTLKAGAAYVPVDPGAPAARGAYILHNCAVKVVIVEAALADKLRSELDALGATPAMIAVAGEQASGTGLRTALDAADEQATAPTTVSMRQPAARPGLHPLHVRLHRPTERRDAVARERRDFRRLVLRDFHRRRLPIAFHRTRRFTSISRSSTSTFA